MTNMLGIKNIQVETFSYIESLNEFLRSHNGHIIDIKVLSTDTIGWFKYAVIYSDNEVK